MATAPFPPARAARIAAHMLNLHSPGEIAEAVNVLLDLLDVIDPDPDAPDFTPVSDGMPGDPADHEPGGDDEDYASTERIDQTRGHVVHGSHDIDAAGSVEDAECDGDETDHDGSEDDHPLIGTTAMQRIYRGLAGCPIADPGACEAGDDHIIGGPSPSRGGNAVDDLRAWDDDCEREQMLHDVPMLPVVSATCNIFTDRREELGIGNLQSSYRTGRRTVRSADSGQLYCGGDDWLARKPGAPV